MEEHRLASKRIEYMFLTVLERLELLGPPHYRNDNGMYHSSRVRTRLVTYRMLEKYDLSGEEWDDNYNKNDG